jgi:hypothetical protein
MPIRRLAQAPSKRAPVLSEHAIAFLGSDEVPTTPIAQQQQQQQQQQAVAQPDAAVQSQLQQQDQGEVPIGGQQQQQEQPGGAQQMDSHAQTQPADNTLALTPGELIAQEQQQGQANPQGMPGGGIMGAGGGGGGGGAQLPATAGVGAAPETASTVFPRPADEQRPISQGRYVPGLPERFAFLQPDKPLPEDWMPTVLSSKYPGVCVTLPGVN